MFFFFFSVSFLGGVVGRLYFGVDFEMWTKFYNKMKLKLLRPTLSFFDLVSGSGTFNS